MSKRVLLSSSAITLVIALLLSACATTPPVDVKKQAEFPAQKTVTVLPASRAGTEQPATTIIPLEPSPAAQSEAQKPLKTLETYPGSGIFINTKSAYRRKEAKLGTGELTINFEATDLQEVVKAILGDILKENYIIDPKVTGTVTIQTSRPLTKEELLPVLENLLRLNGATLVRADGIYKILPQAQTRGGFVAPAARGYGTSIIPLRYIAAREMSKLIEPFLAPDAPKPVIDEQRNLLMLTGTEQELRGLLDMINIFDVDWLKGMSVGLFRLQHAEVKTLAEELEKLFLPKDSPLTGLLRLVPVERLNALLVITQRPDYLKQARHWIERLDQVTDAVGPQLYVYRMKNGKAKDLATVLAGIFGVEAKAPEAEAPAPELAPGETPVEIEAEAARPSPGPGYKPTRRVKTQEGAKPTIVVTETLRIIADEVNNALVIFATPQDYRMIEAALRNLDVVPLQVLIEASVIEVTLTDALEYGVEWFFKNHFGGDRSGQGILDLLGGASPLGPIPFLGAGSGFSYAIFNASNEISFVLNALATATKINVLSSPSLMVLNNQTATIEVVDQIPIITQQQQTTLTQANIINSVEYKDAGVILEVTPRVNVGGRITLELVQEVTDVGAPEPPTQNRRFLKRNIQSTITVQSGGMIVLGGLITDKKDKIKTGIPLLSNLPILGNLFSATTDRANRKELIVLITPKAVRSQEEARAVTEEFRQRLKELEAITPEQYKHPEVEMEIKED